MRKLLFINITGSLLFFILFAGAAPSPPMQDKGAEHNQKGMQYYNEAFYRQLPNGRHQEAEKFFDLAAAEFQNAIAANPNSAKAHRNLARLYYVRKQFTHAAHAYKMLTMLEPRNIDAYVQLALCYIELNQFGEATQELEVAKTKTDNREVIAKLDGYIQKIKDSGQH